MARRRVARTHVFCSRARARALARPPARKCTHTQRQAIALPPDQWRKLARNSGGPIPTLTSNEAYPAKKCDGGLKPSDSIEVYAYAWNLLNSTPDFLLCISTEFLIVSI